MKIHDLTRELQEPKGSKIVLLVADGLGGLPLEPGSGTELETAQTPQLDALARAGVCGLSLPVLPGSPPAAVPATSDCLATTRSNIASAAACSKRSASISRSGPATSPSAATFAPSTIRAGSPIAGPAGRPTNAAGRWSKNSARFGFPRRTCSSSRFVNTALSCLPRRRAGRQVNDTDPQATGVAPLSVKGADSASAKTASLANAFVAEARRY